VRCSDKEAELGYHPETLAFSFPPYPRGGVSVGRESKKPWTFGRCLYGLSPWIGFDIWHIDPERPGTGNRTDDSCGWFDRSPGPYASAVKETVEDRDIIQHIANTIDRQVFWRSAYLEDYPVEERGWKRVTPADALALVLMVGSRLESLRHWHAYRDASWWRRPFLRKLDMTAMLVELALNPSDNLAPSADGSASSFIRLVAGAMNRHTRPWWRHPRWHVHHWKINVAIVRNLRRMLIDRCATCGKRLGFNCCPTRSGGQHHHGGCLGHMAANA
jgi:hypothetical protein